jgi:O-antigen/teichoic acid export membrane protein/O-antigen ligase
VTSPETPPSPAPGAAGRVGLGRFLRPAVLLGALRDTSWLLLLAQASVAVVALLVNILAARSLMASGRGELALALQIAYLSSLGVVLGTDRSLVPVYTGAPVNEVARAQLRLLTRPALVAAALGALTIWVLPLLGLGSWRTVAAVTALFTVTNAFVRSTRSVAIAGHRHRDFVVATIVEQFLLLAALAILAAAGIDSVALWIAAYLVACTGPAAVYLVRWARSGPQPGPDDVVRRRAVRREGLQLVPSSLANTGMLRMDRLLLAAMASTAALGHYASVSTFTELLTWPLLAYADNRTGGWRRRHDEGQLSVRNTLLGAIAFTAIGSVGTAALTWLLIPLLGPGFGTVNTLILPLVAAAGVLGLSQIVISLLIARRRNGWASGSDTTGFVVSLIAYVSLIPHTGAAGAAWGSLIGYGSSLTVGGAALLLPGHVALPDSWRERWHDWRAVGRQPWTGTASGSGVFAPSRGALPGAVLILVAIAGRYTLDRAGFASLAWVDLRVLGLVLACGFIVIEVRACGGLKGTQPSGWLVATMLFFGYQILSAAWAPPGAQIAAQTVDLLCMGVLTFAMYVHARTWPEEAGWRVLKLLWLAGVVFALGAFLVTGPAEQGRYAAFGGGPNVFVRIEILGLFAAITLVTQGVTRHLLWSAPLILAGALLSGSRGGLFAAVAVGAVVILTGRRATRRIALAATAASILVLAVDYALNWPGADLIRTRFVEQTLQQGYLSNRPTLFTSAAQLALDHPLLGVGVDGFRVLDGQRLGVDYAHNYVLSVAAEGGAIGLVLLSVAAALWIRTMFRARPWSALTKTFVAAASFVALASLASGDYYDFRLAWCCAALAAATSRPFSGVRQDHAQRSLRDRGDGEPAVPPPAKRPSTGPPVGPDHVGVGPCGEAPSLGP